MGENKGAAASFSYGAALSDTYKGELSTEKCNLSLIHHTTELLSRIFILINLIKIDPENVLFYRQISTHIHKKRQRDSR